MGKLVRFELHNSMSESSSAEVTLAVEMSGEEQVEYEAKMQLTLLFKSEVGEVLQLSDGTTVSA